MVRGGSFCGGASQLVGGSPCLGLRVSEARGKAERATLPPHWATKGDSRGQDVNPG